MCNELHIQIYAYVNFQFQIDAILYYTYFCCDFTTAHLEKQKDRIYFWPPIFLINPFR